MAWKDILPSRETYTSMRKIIEVCLKSGWVIVDSTSGNKHEILEIDFGSINKGTDLNYSAESIHQRMKSFIDGLPKDTPLKIEYLDNKRRRLGEQSVRKK